MLDRYDQDLLLDYLEDELDADRRAQLEGMLAEDPQLAALLNEMAKDRAALRSVPQAEAPAGLVHDATHAMERRMLLDDTAEETGPIPLSRGRALATEPTRSVSWGRVVGLTGLAASVALAAATLVIMFDDPLERTANELADNSPTETDKANVDSLIGDLDRAESAVDSPAALNQPDPTDGSPTPALAAIPWPADQFDESLALAEDSHREARSQPGDALGPGISREAAQGPLAQISASRPTAAISAIQPEQQLVLISDSPEVSLEQLVEFCVDNGIPVVQPDPIGNRPNGLAPFDLAEQAPFAPNAERQANADDDVADYALLINESQLNALVTNLNSINIDPTRAGKASRFSNQAALLTDLHANMDESPLHDRERSALADPEPAEDAHPSITQQPEHVEQQPTRQLRSPDLGSADANRRNAYNLKTQQQLRYNQQAPLTAAKPSPPVLVDPQQDLAKSDTAQPNREATLREADKIAHKERAGSNGAGQPDRAQADEEAADEADAIELEKVKRDLVVDPARGNWLSPHLPWANTTPLLLSWRGPQVDLATKLVPVTIQRAEPGRVNMLLMRQQIEFANRLKEAAPASDAKPDALAEDNAENLADAPANEVESPEADTPADPAE